MKVKISVSIEQATNAEVESKLAEGLYRNKSHLIEYAVKKLLEKKDE